MNNENTVTFYEEHIDDCRLAIVWHTQPVDGIHARCEQSLHCVQVSLFGPCVHIQSIVHEIHHAVDWLSALGKINGREEQARLCILAVAGRPYGCM